MNIRLKLRLKIRMNQTNKVECITKIDSILVPLESKGIVDNWAIDFPNRNIIVYLNKGQKLDIMIDGFKVVKKIN